MTYCYGLTFIVVRRPLTSSQELLCQSWPNLICRTCMVRRQEKYISWPSGCYFGVKSVKLIYLFKESFSLLRDKVPFDWLIDWLILEFTPYRKYSSRTTAGVQSIDWLIGFGVYAVSEIFQPYNDGQGSYKQVYSKDDIVRMTKEGSTKIVNFMSPGAEILVLGRGHISVIVKMHHFFKNLLLYSEDETN